MPFRLNLREWDLVLWRSTKRIEVISSFAPEDMKDDRWSLLLVAPKSGQRVEFEQVVENDELMMNDSDSLTEGTMQEAWNNESGGRSVPFNLSYTGQPLSLVGMKGSETQQPWSKRWIPEGDRYFLIKCSQFPLNHRHRHHPSNGYLALQVDIRGLTKYPILQKGQMVFEEFLIDTELIFDSPLQLPVRWSRRPGKKSLSLVTRYAT